ncbi:MAG: sporulation domain-containing protein, partial [Propionibacteriales bacterium]|nr:sporulation domain-containing protein [Propionibacteriales bacterium]
HSEVVRLTWTGEVVTASGDPMPLDGLNRVPGKIRNCGGTADDLPTSAPLHDVTCTDADELVAFTTAYGARTPAGEGVEAVLDADGVVTAIRSPRGGPLPSGGSSVQATGTTVDALSDRVDVGDRLQVLTGLADEDGRAVRPSKRTSVVNGGPELVRDGRLRVTPVTDGMLHPDNPSFYYGWAHKRNPRTIAGTDPKGRLVLVTADGRSTDSLGLSILETATVARSLGLRDAINLDGGGSTTMVVDGAVINEPSDGTERPVGDALLVLPGD